ncbi:MAG: hypothetical protein ACXVCP_19250 [Bdellovibrio sp.]
MKKLLLLLLTVGGLSSNAFAAGSIYIAQTAQGINDGSNCANAHGASWFNNSNNWGTGANQITPGTTVFMCGTISTDLTFQGSGASGNYITLDGLGANYSGTISNGTPSEEHSWWRVQNVNYVDGNGGKSPMAIFGGSNGVFTKNYADNFQEGIWIAQGNTSLPDNITISNNFLRTTTADLGLSGQLDIISTEGSTNVFIENNYLEHRAGGNGGGSQHDDIIQTFESGSTGSHGPPRNWTIRYNKIVMNSPSANDRSFTMIEALIGTNYIYGNVFLGIQGAEAANGMSIGSTPDSIFYIYNNTFVAKASASNNTISLGGGTFYLKNNIIYTASGQTAFQDTSTSNTIIRSNNLWFGSDIPSCNGISGELCGYDPLFTDYANNEFSLQAASPALNAGLNLGTPFNFYVVANSVWPGATLAQRVTSGNWAIGAFDFSGVPSATPLQAPFNLRILK